MTRVLALDPATKCGWAYGDGEPDFTEFGTLDFNKAANDLGLLFTLYHNAISDLLEAYQPDYLVVEDTFVGKYKNVARKLYGYQSQILSAAYIYKTPLVYMENRSVKKYMTGNGNADKIQMQSAAKLRGFEIEDEHQADAIGVMLLFLDTYDHTDKRKD